MHSPGFHSVPSNPTIDSQQLTIVPLARNPGYAYVTHLTSGTSILHTVHMDEQFLTICNIEAPLGECQRNSVSCNAIQWKSKMAVIWPL